MAGNILLALGYIVAFIFVFLVALFVYVNIMNMIAKKRYAEYRTTGWTRGSIRTPDERFSNFAGYAFEPHYVEIDGLRMHYLDEGPPDVDPILLMHGEPSWSYLYRKMIPIIVKNGHRVITPDLIGFGRSDKLMARIDYSYQMHVDMLDAFIKKLDLKNVTLFCQDWGGLIGLRVVAENQERFARIVVANTGLPGIPPASTETGEKPQLMPIKSLVGFVVWLISSQMMPKFNAGFILQFGTVTKLGPDVVAAYDAPFPNKRYVAGARMFPVLVPSQIKESTRAWETLSQWKKPLLTAFSDRDPVLGGGDRVFQEVVPGAKGQQHTTIRNAGHFLQEDKGEDLAELVVDFVARTAG